MELFPQSPARRFFLAGLSLSLAGLIVQRPGLPAASPPVNFQDTTPFPREAGLIRWSRSLKEAQEESRRTGRLIMVLFQEIPGCQG